MRDQVRAAVLNKGVAAGLSEAVTGRSCTLLTQFFFFFFKNGADTRISLVFADGGGGQSEEIGLGG